MNDLDRDALLNRLDERSEATLNSMDIIKDDVKSLFGQTRDHESRISNIEGSKNMMFKLFGSGGLLAGIGYGLSQVIDKIFNR